MASPILNIADPDFVEFGNGGKFAAKIASIGATIGLEQLGCMVTIVEPGNIAFPFHNHHSNDEMFIILEGAGEYRFGEETFAIKMGDILAAPAGGPEVAHQIINSGDVTLKYLGISTKKYPEVVEYPDSDKFSVTSRVEDGTIQSAKFRHLGRTKDTLDYWDGEDNQ